MSSRAEGSGMAVRALPPPFARARAQRDARLREFRERARVRRHLRLAERTLRRARVDHLGAPQRAARRRALKDLRAYRRRGVFPRNTDFPGQRVPYLRDRFGTSCAVAHLAESFGRGDLIDALQAHDNHVLLAGEEGGPLAEWLRDAGLSEEEAARVQPSYDHGGLVVQPDPAPVPLPGPQGTDAMGLALALALVALVPVEYLVIRWHLRRRAAAPRAGRGHAWAVSAAVVVASAAAAAGVVLTF